MIPGTAEAPLLVDLLFWTFAAGSVVAGWRVFRTDSMVRAAFWLLGSFVAMGAILLLLHARFLALVLMLMMAGEMTIMAVFMVMFMMNPAGLNPMQMVHQHRTAIAAGLLSFLALGAVGFLADFPSRPFSGRPEDVTAELGVELLGDSMLVFETAGVTLLATMIAAIALASRRGRFGPADEGSRAPALEPGGPAPAEPLAVQEEDEEGKGRGGEGDGKGRSGHGESHEDPDAGQR